jgi:DNA-directed RNA polymerase specialized sigma24 family protein
MAANESTRPPDRREIEASTEALLSCYSPYLARISIQLPGRRTKIDDLIQDVFVVAIDKSHTDHDPDAMKAWLATITVRLAIARLRKRR